MPYTQSAGPEANGAGGEQVETNHQGTTLDAALAMVERGCFVFPVDHPALPTCVGVRTASHSPASCTERGKHPAVGKWSLEATARVQDIVAHFAGTTRNYAIDCRASCLVVIDEDVLNRFQEYAEERSHTIPRTFTVSTGRPGGGRHFYFRVPRDNQFTNATGDLPKGIDVRARNGYVVGPGSVHASGAVYQADDWTAPFADLPAWLAEAIITKATQGESVPGEPVDRPLSKRIIDLLDDSDPKDRSERFYRIVRELLDAGFTQGQAVTVLTPWCAQHGKYVGRVEAEVARSWAKPAGEGTPPPQPGQPAGGATAGRPKLDVGNSATMADWLRMNIGTGPLAGMFVRGPDIVHTPREGEAGYEALRGTGPDDSDGPAQVRVASRDYIAARVQYTYDCYKLVKRGEDYEPQPAMFPTDAARTATHAVDMLPNLRRLKGVIHTPVFRPDGSLIDVPGYDPATKLLYLPEPGLVIPAVAVKPSAQQVREAVALLDMTLAGFPFTSLHGRANYIGALVTPLLRALTPPPYKLVAIGAHQRGSGKTKLAQIPRIIHGGVFRAEMPEDDAELRKQVTSVLSHTTGPVVVLDNVSGILRSSTLAGLLTSAEWGDRPLGATAWVGVPNDRLWVITGNNLNLGGDIPRRTVSVTIDPGVPRPELRTGFVIGDPELWAKDQRPNLLHALLTIVQAWVADGMPLPREKASDGYARWVRVVEGILAHAGVPGEFDHSSTQIEVGSDDDEWGDFLAAVHRVRGEGIWTAKQLLADIDTGMRIDPKPIPMDALPGELADKASRAAQGPPGIARTLGMWLSNRDGRWAGALTVRSAGKDRDGTKIWKIQPAPGQTLPASAGTAGTAGTISAPYAGEVYDPNTVRNSFVHGAPGEPPETSPQSPQSPHFPRAPLPAGVPAGVEDRPAEPDRGPNYCPRCQQTTSPMGWGPCDRCGRPTHYRGRGSHGPTCQACLAQTSERTAS